MKAYHGVAEVGIIVAEAEHGLNGRGVDVGQEEHTGACSLGTSDDFGAVGVELLCVDVGVGVDIGH